MIDCFETWTISRISKEVRNIFNACYLVNEPSATVNFLLLGNEYMSAGLVKRMWHVIFSPESIVQQSATKL